MNKLAVLLTAIIIGVSCTTTGNSISEVHQKVDVLRFLDGLKTNKGNTIVVDVRTPSEFNKGKIKDAININFYDSDFQLQISKLDTSKVAYIYCKSGGRSNKAAKTFEKAGFKKVIKLKGGFNAYLKK